MPPALLWSSGGTAVSRTAVGTPLEAREVRTTYTPNGRVESLTDGELNHTYFLYDGHDRLWRTQYPLPQRGANAANVNDYDERSYDPAGNLASFRNRVGEVTTFTYDALGRRLSESGPHGTTAAWFGSAGSCPV